ncbi:hypothetical protein PFISCL1PPCAC_278, partial [Pristionchus fissidentatus]
LHFSLLLTSPLLFSLQFPSTMRLQIVATILLIAMFSGMWRAKYDAIIEDLKKIGKGSLAERAKKNLQDEYTKFERIEKGGSKSELRTEYTDFFCEAINSAVEPLGKELFKDDPKFVRKID